MSVELAPSLPHITGPTWQKTADGNWHLPERTLGWGILNWWATYVKSPGGDSAGEPFMPTLEQTRFMLWWYAVDENGKYVYSQGVLRRLKGWGKDPFAAALSLAELCGPVAFSHFDADGNAVGKARHAARIQIAAVSREQTDNTFSMFPIMMTQKLKDDYGLNPHMFVIHTGSGGRIEAVTSSPASMDGKRPTFIIMNEIQWWGVGPSGEVNNGHAMEAVIRGNVIKVPDARSLSICNAHIPGYDSIGELYYNKWQDIESGKAVDVNLLYDALEAPADTPLSEIPSQKEDPEGYEAGVQKLREGIDIARGNSYWLPLDEIVTAVLDTGGRRSDGAENNTVVESRRMFLNQVNAHEDSWISPAEWDRLAMVDKTFSLKKGEQITLGFDGSKSNDWTALVACRVFDGMLFVISVWDPEKYPSGEIPRDAVDATVRSCFEAYDVVAFRADVKEFESYVDQWSKDFGKKLKVKAAPNSPIAFDMRGQTKKFAFDCEKFVDAVVEREVVHNGDPILRQHVLNARRHPTIYDAISIRKQSKDSSRKIDAAVCAVLAFAARQDFFMSKDHRGRGGAVFK